MNALCVCRDFCFYLNIPEPWAGAKFADLVEKPEMEVEGGARYKGQWRGNMRLGYLGSKLGCCEVSFLLFWVSSWTSYASCYPMAIRDGNGNYVWYEWFSHTKLHLLWIFHGISSPLPGMAMASWPGLMATATQLILIGWKWWNDGNHYGIIHFRQIESNRINNNYYIILV